MKINYLIAWPGYDVMTATTLTNISRCHIKQGKAVKVVHFASDVKADVSVRGLAKKFRVLHLTDTHISVFDEREKQYHEQGGSGT